MPAKVKVTHSTPGATCLTLATRSSKAKLKMTMTSRAKTNIELNISLVRNSATISL